ncbi:endo-1,3-alpha-glucanase family glycosylhydrolase [Poriferisphaera sp. WC338]|uniref:endo-1,3-alpha-glucanase family glycosylhydrolase n=1 Tax=Poriferisphaera sp. WC338 TaxID=3425129 RepID=UPI003D812FFE
MEIKYMKWTAGIALMILGVVGLGCSLLAEDAPVVEQKAASTEGKWNIEGDGPHLIAHYMAWFEAYGESGEGAKTWRHWRWDGSGSKRNPEKVDQDGRREISSVYYPLIGPYNSRDRAVVRYHMRTAKAAGVSAFVVIWYGKDTPDSDALMPMLLKEAAKVGLKIAVCYEEKINWQPYRQPTSRSEIVKTATEDLNYLLNTYGGHDAYLKRDGKPFVMQFNYWGEDDLGPRQIMAAEWQQIYEGLDKNIYFCRQNMDRPDVHPPVQSAFMWFKPNKAEWANDFKYFGATARKLEAEKKLDFFMTVLCPGFDTTNVNGWGGGPRVLERNGTDVLEFSMEHALTGNPELIQIMTWNDWEEGTAIEPSREFGFDYIDTIETWWGKVSGRPVDLEDNKDGLRELIEESSAFQKKEMQKGLDRIGIK